MCDIKDGSDVTKQQSLCRQETNIELEFLRQSVITKDDLVISTRDLAALATLHRSIVCSTSLPFRVTLTSNQVWFSEELNALKSIPENALSPTSPSGLEPPTASMAVTPFLPPTSSDSTGQLKLPLSREMGLCVSTFLRMPG